MGFLPRAKMHENTPMIGDHDKPGPHHQNVNVTGSVRGVDEERGSQGKSSFCPSNVLFVPSFVRAKGTKGSSEQGPHHNRNEGVLLPTMW